MLQSSLAGRNVRIVKVLASVPLPRLAENIYYALIAYAILAPAWGVSIPLLGAGGLALLAMYCILRLKKSGISIYKPIALPLGCAVSFVAVQVVIHGVSFMDPSNRQFVTWILTLIVVQSLSLRQGFLHRFSLAALVIGTCLLPFLNLGWSSDTAVERAGLEQGVGFSNPNDLAAWFGFCAVYFTVLVIESKRHIVRIASLPAVAGCLFLVGLTVSRGALVAIAIAIIVASRRLLKRGFFPVLILATLSSLLFLSGLFEQSVGLYTARGTEETGRLLVWPLVIERILASPFSGVGAYAIGTYVPESGHPVEPHNSFLGVGLASGIIPLAFFIAYWIKAMRGAYRLSRRGLQDAPFQLPLIIYAFTIASLSAGAYMFPWAIVTLCTAMSADVPRRVHRMIVSRFASHKAVGLEGQ
jgi:uncharacterized protein (TIGR04206 family)